MKNELCFALVLILFFSLLAFIPTSYAQTTLRSGQTSFSTVSIVFSNLQFSGDLNSLRIYWNTTFITGTIPQIGVKCYLNCNPLSQNCDGLPNNCTYLGPPGLGVCTIQPVQYSYPLDSQQNATCIFYNPSQPSVQYKKSDGTYPNTTFYPLKFDLFISQNFTVTVGKEFSMYIIIKNNGVFNDSYIQTVNAFPSNLIAIDPRTQTATIGPLKGNSFGSTPETFTSIAKVVVLSTSSPIDLFVYANSTTSNTVYQMRTVEIRAGISSLPDFSWVGILQIIVLASAVLFFKLKT